MSASLYGVYAVGCIGKEKMDRDISCPQIFVVIPVYNVEKYLQQCVRSVVDQQYQNLWIILVDDGSKDGSPVLCDELADTYEHIVVIHKRNEGLPKARNTGIEYVFKLWNQHHSLAYLAFLDSDDAWYPAFLDNDVITTLTAGYQLVGMQSCRCNGNMTFHAEPNYLDDKVLNGGQDSIWCHSTQSFAAMFYSLEFLDRYKLRFIDVKHVEDKMFSLRCTYLADKICLMPKLMYLYRNNSASLVHTRPAGTEYYPVIIDAYLQMEKEMEKYRNTNRGYFDQGIPLAQLYLLDMIDEHFQYFRSKKDLTEFLESRKDYKKLLCAPLRNSVANTRYLQMCKNSTAHRLRCWIHGTADYIGRWVLSITVIKKRVEAKRYPIPIPGELDVK